MDEAIVFFILCISNYICTGFPKFLFFGCMQNSAASGQRNVKGISKECQRNVKGYVS